jgi:hypothetical protein
VKGYGPGFIKYNDTFLTEKGSDNKRDIQYTSVYCKTAASVTNCDYCENIGLVEKIFVPVLVFEIILHSPLKLKPFSHMPKR